MIVKTSGAGLLAITVELGMAFLSPVLFVAAGFLVNPTNAFSQSRIRVLSVTCQAATGSVPAGESLTQLRGLSEATPELSEAVSSCQSRYEELLSQEKVQWNLGIAARDRLDCQTAKRLFQELLSKRSAYQREARDELNKLVNCTASPPAQPAGSASGDADALNALRQAQGAFNTRNFVAAKSLAQSVGSRNDQIGEEARALVRSIEAIELSNERYRNALVAITRKEFEKACQLLREIEVADPSFAGLAAAKSRAGGCVPVDRFKGDYERAVHLLEDENYQEARKVLQAIRGADAGYRDVGVLLDRVEKAIEAEREKTIAQALSQAAASVEQSIRQGDLDLARRRLTVAMGLHPNQKSLEALKARLEQAQITEEEALLPGVDSYYRGQYLETEQLLGRYLMRKHPRKLTALACFYLGAAAVSQYYLKGATDDSKKKEGMRYFTQATQHYQDFLPPWSTLSPRIKEVYTEATGRQP